MHRSRPQWVTHALPDCPRSGSCCTGACAPPPRSSRIFPIGKQCRARKGSPSPCQAARSRRRNRASSAKYGTHRHKFASADLKPKASTANHRLVGPVKGDIDRQTVEDRMLFHEVLPPSQFPPIWKDSPCGIPVAFPTESSHVSARSAMIAVVPSRATRSRTCSGVNFSGTGVCQRSWNAALNSLWKSSTLIGTGLPAQG